MKILILFLSLLSFSAQSAPLFDDESLLEIKLSYNISKLRLEKDLLREKGLQGTLIIESHKIKIPIKILARGKGSFSCKQPQLKIKFNKQFSKNTIFRKLKKVKLFTKGTCLKARTDSEQDKEIVANYLIYKLYEQMTEYSFKTRLLKIHYTDESGEIESYTQYAFFLEPKKHLESRLNLKIVKYTQLLQFGPQIKAIVNMSLVSRCRETQRKII